MPKSMVTVTKVQRIRLVRAYMRELKRICNENCGGDWEKMPPRAAGLPIRWDSIIAAAGVQTTPAGASRLVESSVSNDDVMNAV